MLRTMNLSWKQLSEKLKDKYNQIADADKARYKKEK